MTRGRRGAAIVPQGDFAGEEFYDEDDIEDLDEQADAEALAAFDAEALSEDEEARQMEARAHTGRGGRDDPHVAACQRL